MGNKIMTDISSSGSSNKYELCRKIGFWLVLIMALLQGFYAVKAFIDPISFATLRGTLLLEAGDADWVRIYASRTLFVALIVAALLYLEHYVILKWTALLALVMPLSDALLAYFADATNVVLIKHILTMVYLTVTFFVLHYGAKSDLFASKKS